MSRTARITAAAAITVVALILALPTGAGAAGWPGGVTGGHGRAVHGPLPRPHRPPATPAGLTVTGTTSSSVSLAWAASAGATSYGVYRGGALVASPAATAYTDTGLAASTGYSYAVDACNTAGCSTQTAPVQATTRAATTGCDLEATTATFAAQFAAATAGQTVCLASGNYGTFTGGAKTGMVTVQPEPGASVTMALGWNGASYVTVTGVTITGALIQGASHNLTISYSTVSPGFIHLLTDQFDHANILIDHDTFPDTIATSGEGRVWTDFSSVNTTNTIGVTVSNSLFSGGDMIGVLAEGGAGLQILNNEFTGMDNRINEAIHSDLIFNYGADHLVIKGNWFHDQVDVPSCSWAQWDGGAGNVFEDNVVSQSGPAGCYESLAVLGDSGSVISHNVFGAGQGEAGPVGQIQLGGKTSEGAGSGTVIRDNILTEIDNGDGGLNSTYGEDHNLCAATCGGTGDQGPGTGDITGVPLFAGGTAPASFAGFALAPGSPGTGAASDGTNTGIELPTGG